MQSPARTLTPARYAETFGCFASRTSEYNSILDRLVEATALLQQPFSCLDVGAGTGMLLRNWHAASNSRLPSRYVGIEPNPNHSSLLHETLTDLKIQGDVVTVPFQDLQSPPNNEPFDLILFSHSLYWLPNPVECIQKALSWVKPNGFVLIFHQGPFGFYTFNKLFECYLERDVPVVPNHGLSSHEIIMSLRQAGYYPDLTMDPANFDLTNLSKRERGNSFLYFASRI